MYVSCYVKWYIIESGELQVKQSRRLVLWSWLCSKTQFICQGLRPMGCCHWTSVAVWRDGTVRLWM